MIDWDRVRELREEVGEEEFAEVVELFFEEIEESVARLPKVKGSEPLAHALHFLRSVSLNLGFVALAKRCEEGEALAECGETDAIDVPATVACYRASKAEFLEKAAQQHAA